MGEIEAINITTRNIQSEQGDLDDVDESLPDDKKFAEVNSLINKYEKAEKKVKWLHSDAYKQSLIDKAKKKTQEKMTKI